MKYILIAIFVVILVGIMQAFKNNKGKLLIKNADLLEAGRLLYPQNKVGFEEFYNSFLIDKNSFLSDYQQLLEEYDNFELDELKALDVIYIFGDSNGLLWMTDWRGEENEMEIEDFLETKLQIKPQWTNTKILRQGIDEEKLRDGKFIIDLLKSIDKDLKPLNKRLIFLDLAWDAYVYTAIDTDSFNTITNKFGALFHGTEKFKK